MSTPSNHIANNIVHFARILRRAGLTVGPRQILSSIEAIKHAGLENSDDLYWALHSTLINKHEATEIFDQAFHLFWRDPRMLERMISLMLPEIATPPTDPHEKSSRRLAEALLKQSPDAARPEEIEFDIDASATMSDAEVLRTKDFEQMSAAELREAQVALRKLKLAHDMVTTRRTRPASHGRQIDMRATMKASLRAGDIIPLKRRDRRQQQPPLVVLCDISGSMGIYARVFLHFLHSLSNDRSRMHTFLFGTRLTNVTRYLRNRDIDEALSSVASAVEDWDGGTRIGETLRRFNIDWARRVLGQGATVLLITDGLDRDAGEGLEAEISKLHRSSRRLIWLNPLLRYDQFEPKALGIRKMLPHVDEFRAVHNISSLADLVATLNGTPTTSLKVA